MTSDQKFNIKLKIIREFKGVHFTMVEMFKLFDEIKSELSNYVIEQELKKLKFRREK